ncbi:MAG: GGDEF domain-containing protein [Lachnospiraceae bacterium]|nr:GGDEF domain-containing protein [Lachnospiraceae bacterium]
MENTIKKGISHRRLHLLMTLIIIIFSGAIILFTLRLTDAFLRITSASEQYSELQASARELMNASDYLTEQVQRFTLNGDRKFMDNYFTEAFESRRREEALEAMDANPDTEEAKAKLEAAMASSVKLMDQEYYAMRLVIEAKGYTDYPEVLQNIELTEEDAALSVADKIRKANELVLGDSYYEQKDIIRQNMQESYDEIEKLADNYTQSEMAKLRRYILLAHVAVFLQAALIFAIMGLTSMLAINPVHKAIDEIKAGLPIEERGSKELRYLARAYNKIYEKNKSSIETLNYKASHDELTGAYNRAGYEYILSTLDMNSTYMLLFDADDFKGINDNYGHEVGDKVLIKIVNTFKKVFRDDDCICRIGGDEFVVFLKHSGEISHSLIEFKINQIIKFLEDTSDGLPPVSISAGVVSGKNATDTEDLFEKSDKAMYMSKTNGKRTFTFSE